MKKIVIVAPSTQVGLDLARQLGLKNGTFVIPSSVEHLRGIGNASILLMDGWEARKDVSVPDMKKALDVLRMYGCSVYRLASVGMVK
jgi:hypothetical protein